jgi:hypothetical protein
MLTAERDVIHNIALWFALALAQRALAQTVPTAAPKPSPTKPSPAKPAAKKPEPPKPDAAAQSGPCGIGVIPHIGENFALQSFGITVFGNELKKVPIVGARRPSLRPRARRCRSTFRGAPDGLSGQRVCDV